MRIVSAFLRVESLSLTFSLTVRPVYVTRILSLSLSPLPTVKDGRASVGEGGSAMFVPGVDIPTAG